MPQFALLSLSFSLSRYASSLALYHVVVQRVLMYTALLLSNRSQLHSSRDHPVRVPRPSQTLPALSMATHIASSKKTILLASARARNTRPRKTTRRPRQGNLSQSQAAACRKAAETRKKVQKEIELEHRRQTGEAERIATAYGVGLKGVLRRVKNASKAVKKRKPNVHNAFIFMKSLDLSNRAVISFLCSSCF